jgi:hypothetical protein
VGRWNIVAIIVLLCQGLLFENSFAEVDGTVYVCGVLIVVMVSLCLGITAYSSVKKIINPTLNTMVKLPWRSAQKLPQDMNLQLYVLNSLIKLDHEREIEINILKIKEVLPKNEFQELLSAMAIVYKPHHQTKESSQWGDGTFALESVLPRKPSGEVTPQMLNTQDKILADFSRTIFSQPNT